MYLSLFPYPYNKFNKTGGRMQDTIYHMTLCRKMAAHVNSKVSGICAVWPEPCYLLTEIVGQRKKSKCL